MGRWGGDCHEAQPLRIEDVLGEPASPSNQPQHLTSTLVLSLRLRNKGEKEEAELRCLPRPGGDSAPGLRVGGQGSLGPPWCGVSASPERALEMSHRGFCTQGPRPKPSASSGGSGGRGWKKQGRPLGGNPSGGGGLPWEIPPTEDPIPYSARSSPLA